MEAKDAILRAANKAGHKQDREDREARAAALRPSFKPRPYAPRTRAQTLGALLREPSDPRGQWMRNRCGPTGAKGFGKC